MRARLVESREIGPDVRHFLFDVPETDNLEYTPGQFVSFSEMVLGRPVTRAYSVCSAPDGNRFELCLNRVREGLFSPWLFEMAPGDTVHMSGPQATVRRFRPDRHRHGGCAISGLPALGARAQER
jgi:ferredoxin-NADP reductase